MKQIEKKITVPFPAVHYNVSIEFEEVQRASGVSYILMVLIANNNDDTQTLANILKSFDIPVDLHDIFANELYNMVQRHVVEMKLGVAHKAHILEWPTSNFVFTDLGEEMYQKGMYLTGNNQKKSISIIFMPESNEFTNKTNLGSSLKDELIEIIGEKWNLFVEQGNEKVNTWIKQNPAITGLKKGTQITSVAVESAKILRQNTTNNVIMNIADDGIGLSFSSPEQEGFFHTYYDASIANAVVLNGIGTFVDLNGQQIIPDSVSLSDDVSDIYFPSEMESIINRPDCYVAVNRERLFGKIKDDNILIYTASANEILDSIDNGCELLFLNISGGYSYVPATLECELAGNIYVLLKKAISDEDFNKTLITIFENYKLQPLTIDTFNMIEYLSNADKTGHHFITEYAEHICTQLNTDKEIIDFLFELNQKFHANEEWKQYFDNKVDEMFEIALSNATIKDVPYLNELFKKIYENNGKEVRDFYVRIIRKFKGEISDSEILDVIESVGCKPENVLSEINIIPEYSNSILNNSEIMAKNSLAARFNGCCRAFNALKDLLGINDSNNEDGETIFDIDSFFKYYVEFDRYYKDISSYKHLADNEFAEIEKFVPAFQQYHEQASIRKMADSSPEKLSKSEIDKLIKSGEFNRVIEILNYKAQLALSKISGIKGGTLGNLIILTYDIGGIDYVQKDKLLAFKDCRNPLQHPNLPKIPFTKADLKEWSDIILNLETTI